MQASIDRQLLRSSHHSTCWHLSIGNSYGVLTAERVGIYRKATPTEFSHDRPEGKLSRRIELLGARESLKETAAVPTRTLGAVGDSFDDLQISSIEAGCCFKIDRLLKIV